VLRFSEHLSGVDGEAMFRHACALGLEGIVSKRLMSRYDSRSGFPWPACRPAPNLKGSAPYTPSDDLTVASSE
jgi:hypothetical protein